MDGNQSLSEKNKPRRKPGYWVWLALGAAGLLLLALLAINLLLPSKNPLAVPPDTRNDPALGAPNAPVTIIEFGDFACSACKDWYKSGNLETVLTAFQGRVRFVWRDFPISSAESPQAAEAARCAFEQGKFWGYHDLLFDKAPALSVADLKSYAAQVDLDTAAFDACLDTRKYQSLVDQELGDARGRNITEAPTFLINNKAYPGPLEYTFMMEKVNALLAGSGN